MATRAVCPACQRSVFVNANGSLRVHGPRSNQCPGSNLSQTNTSLEYCRDDNPMLSSLPLRPPSSISPRSSHLSDDSDSSFNPSDNIPLQIDRDTPLDSAEDHGHYLEAHEARDMFLHAYGTDLHEPDPNPTSNIWFLHWKTITQLSGAHYNLPHGPCGHRYISVLIDEINLTSGQASSERLIVLVILFSRGKNQ